MNVPSLIYEPNPKHKEPWQIGRKGSLCPRSMTEPERDRLVTESVLEGGKRYATDGSHAYCAQEHAPGRLHGYPVGWKEVPERVRRAWLLEGKIDRRTVRQFWEGGDG
jgi:hypothetical protein